MQRHTLAEQVLRMAAADHDGDLDGLLTSITTADDVAITLRGAAPAPRTVLCGRV